MSAFAIAVGLAACSPAAKLPADTGTTSTHDSTSTDSTSLPDDSGTDSSTTDSDSAGLDTADDDGDGWSEAQGDCDDADPTIKPEYRWESCNDRDDDCDGIVDEGCGTGVARLCGEWEVETTSSGELVRAWTGNVYRNSADEEVCRAYRTLVEAEPAPPGCPDCTWSFAFGVGGWGEEGTWCDTMDLDALEDDLARDVETSETVWTNGFAPEYEYNGHTYYNAVFYGGGGPWMRARVYNVTYVDRVVHWQAVCYDFATYPYGDAP
jgi:hypothetical protein